MSAQIVQSLVFYLLAALVVISCAIVVFAQNIVHAVFALFVTLLAVAGFYALLGADFLAVTQVVVYVGGILVLLLFGILLTSRMPIILGLTTRRTYLLAVLAGSVVLALLTTVIIGSGFFGQHVTAQPKPTIESLGELLLGRYLFPFEFASLTLLVALIGAAYLVRRSGR
ncbi:NADH-quinone oxidoreductase subunit J [Candidatus Sumerlaeota bacterium]|nr:NADH-quinone oxidoreductase subunit J [Candidatus Sumerlaeota bacterium]